MGSNCTNPYCRKPSIASSIFSRRSRWRNGFISWNFLHPLLIRSPLSSVTITIRFLLHHLSYSCCVKSSSINSAYTKNGTLMHGVKLLTRVEFWLIVIRKIVLYWSNTAQSTGGIENFFWHLSLTGKLESCFSVISPIFNTLKYFSTVTAIFGGFCLYELHSSPPFKIQLDSNNSSFLLTPKRQ